MAWTVAPALEILRHQLNEMFPRRSKASDGGIGDENHSARSSDHNPNSARVVCARDFTHDPKGGLDCQWLADTLVENKDSRIKYLIWNKQICSSKTSPWKWRPYSGVNAHRHHLHISVGPDAKLYNDARKWDLDTGDDVAKVTDDEIDDVVANIGRPANPFASLMDNIASTAVTPLPVSSDLPKPADALASDVVTPGQPDASPPIVSDAQTQPSITNTVVEEKKTEATPEGETVTTTTAQSVAAPVEVTKEQPSLMVRIAAPFTALAGLGINAGSLIQSRLENMSMQQIGYMAAALGLVVAAIWWWHKSAKAAQIRTMQLVDTASDPAKTTVTLKK